MATTIKLKNGSGAPLAGDLVAGEPALDLTNKRLYTEDSGGTVIEVGTNPSTINIDAGTIDGTVIGGTTPAAVTTSSLVATTADIDAGSIDGTVIGGTTAAAGSFTTFTSTGIDDNAASTAMTLDASGNLLVGNTVTDPATSNVNGVAITAGGEVIASLNGVAAQFNRRISDGDVAVFKKGGDTKGSIGILSSRLYIGSGDTGIKFSGADDLIAPIDASDGTGRDAAIDLGSSGARFKDLYLSGGLRGDTTFKNNAGTTEYARFDSSGNLLVGQSINATPAGNNNVGAAIDASGGISGSKTGVHVLELNRTEDDTNNREYVRFYRVGSTNLAGTITATKTVVAYNTSSDQRLKENIVDAPSASDDIDAIQVRSFDWKADGSHQKYGMVAQELQSVAPEAVSEGATEEDMMGVDYSKLVPMLVKEIQSLRARVAQLEGAN